MRIPVVVHLTILPLMISSAQGQSGNNLWSPADTFDQTRFTITTIAGTAAYSATLISLNSIWYSKYDRSSFHFFDDFHEWNQMDKFGHLSATYFQTELLFGLARWTGMQRCKAMWLAFGLSNSFQLTFEILDGFSSNWGFSLSDVGFNIVGGGTFLLQELLWQQQIVRFKFSSAIRQYPRSVLLSTESPIAVRDRADDLFGKSFLERLIKDYNAQTIWVSVDLARVTGMHNFPKWLNIAMGYGVDNMFVPSGYQFNVGDVPVFIDPSRFPRGRQFYLSPDVDLSQIRTKSYLLKGLLSIINVLKIPAPAVQYHTQEGWKLHWLIF